MKRPFSGRPGSARLIDPERIATEALAEPRLGHSGRLGRPGTGQDHPVRVDDTDDEQQLRRQQSSGVQVCKGRAGSFGLVGILDNLQCLIDFTQRAHDLRLVGVDQLQSGRSRGTRRIGALDLDEI